MPGRAVADGLSPIFKSGTKTLSGWAQTAHGCVVDERNTAMKAARFHGPKDIRIEDVPESTVRPGAVAIDVAWCGICGTDLHEYLEGPIFIPVHRHPHPLSHESDPVTMGHEFSGTISELGEGVTDLTIGDNVVVEPLFACGDCDPCRSGHYNLCVSMGFIELATAVMMNAPGSRR
jgi:(R,R)-butanediol dehydrogenase/meso-butanediol dehydrogenase/diacetyl reductase